MRVTALPSGGTVKLKLAKERLAAGAGRGGLVGDFAVVSVKDTGVGISADMKERVFEPYFTTKAEKGNGLGLSQVYGFAKQSGGGAFVESELGRGATFSLYFPISTEQLAADEAASVPETDPISGGRVLLVEDNPEVAIVAAEQLKQCGCTVIQVDNAKAAIDVLNNDPDIDLLFSDIVMPGMSGLELGRWTRKKLPDIPVVLASGYSEQASAAMQEGFALLSKPYSFDTLKQVLARSGMRCRPS